MLIYMATNVINGKQYVGQTINSLRQRRKRHIYDTRANKDNNYFHRSIRKHGEESFEWIIIHNDVTNIDDLNRLEEFYIGFYNTFGSGYNSTTGGKNAIPSEEAKKQMSIARKGEKNGFYGKKHSEKSKRKMSKFQKGKTVSEESRKKMSENHSDVSGKNNPMFGKKRSEESKRKQSKAMKGGKRSEETKRRMSVAQKGKLNHMYGKKLSEDHKRKLSKANRGKNSPRAKAIIIGDKYFDTRVEAAKFVGVGPGCIRKRILHKTMWKNYHYAEKRGSNG